MWRVSRILVATDFGEASEAAGKLGLVLAQRFHASLSLMHACPNPETLTDLPFGPANEYMKLVSAAAQKALQEQAGRLGGRGVEISTVLEMGRPWELILDAARKRGADLIVVGTHGRRGVSRALIGSVAEKVVRLSPVPVLTVRAKNGREAGHSVATQQS
jgi:nucleotide-binding universal stress UspA family protein